MYNKYTVFLILAILVIVLLWNKNEHIDTTTDNLTAKNITASGSTTLNVPFTVIDASGVKHLEIGKKPDGYKYVQTVDDVWMNGGRLIMNGGGLTMKGGPLNVNGPTLFTKDVDHQGSVHFGGFGTDTYLPASDGRNYIRGPTNIDGATLFTKDVDHRGSVPFGGFGTDTYLPAGDGRNYIRGPTNMDGDTLFTKSATINGGLTVGGIVTAKKFVSTDGASGSPLSNEAIQTIASVYNKDNLTATNINATNSINTPTLSATNITASGDINGTKLNVSGVGTKDWNKIAGQTVFEGGRTDFWHTVVVNAPLWTNDYPIFANNIWGANNNPLKINGTVCFGGSCFTEDQMKKLRAMV